MKYSASCNVPVQCPGHRTQLSKLRKLKKAPFEGENCPLMQVYNCSDSSDTCIGPKPQRPMIPTPRWNRRTVFKVRKHKAPNGICPVIHSQHVGSLLATGVRRGCPEQGPGDPVRMWFLQEQTHVVIPSKNVMHSQLHGCMSMHALPAYHKVFPYIYPLWGFLGNFVFFHTYLTRSNIVFTTCKFK